MQQHMCLPWFCYAIVMLLPCHCHFIIMRLTCACHAITMRLQCYLDCIAMLLPWSCHDIAMFVCHVIVMMSPCYCHALALYLSCDCHDCAMTIRCHGVAILVPCAMLLPGSCHDINAVLPSYCNVFANVLAMFLPCHYNGVDPWSERHTSIALHVGVYSLTKASF
jgi:hypothetical protein